MKKYIALFILIVFVAIPFAFAQNVNETVYCDDQLTSSEIEDIIEDSVESQLGDLDFSELEDALNSLDNTGKEIFGNDSFLDKIKQIITGEFAQGQQSIWTS